MNSLSRFTRFLLLGRPHLITYPVSGVVKCNHQTSFSIIQLYYFILINLHNISFLGQSFHYSSINSVQAKKYIFAQRFVGLPKLEDIQLVEEQLPEIKDRGRFFHSRKSGFMHELTSKYLEIKVLQ